MYRFLFKNIHLLHIRKVNDMKSKEEIQDGCAQLLRKLREDAGLSVPKMADMVQVDKRTWQRYEDGLSAPTVPEFLEIFNCLGVDALSKVLELIYPDYSDLSAASSASYLRRALLHYIGLIASDRIVRELDYLIFGDHGSNFVPQLEEFVALDHLPMIYRYSIAKQIMVYWQLCSATGDLIGTDHIMPDIDRLTSAIAKGEEAAIQGRNSYTTSIYK